MAGKLILVRHGESEANRDRCFSASDDVPLTSWGRLQAQCTATRIAQLFRPARVFSSEFLRARQTAEIIAAKLGLPTESIPGIHERDFGCLRGFPYQQLDDLIASDPAYNRAHDWLWAPPGGESRDDVRRRVIPALEQVAVNVPGEEVVVVAHGVVMVAVWAHLTGKWEGANVPANCGMVLVEHHGGQLGAPQLVDGSSAAPGQSEAG